MIHIPAAWRENPSQLLLVDFIIQVEITSVGGSILILK